MTPALILAVYLACLGVHQGSGQEKVLCPIEQVNSLNECFGLQNINVPSYAVFNKFVHDP